MATAYLDETLAEFSGYIAADELYDGPYCVLSIVDKNPVDGVPTQEIGYPNYGPIIRPRRNRKTGPMTAKWL